MSLKYCPKCGNKLESGSQFCDSCGANLGNHVTIPEITPTQAIPSQKTQSYDKRSTETVIYAESLPRIAAFIIDGIIIGLIGTPLTWIFVPLNFLNPMGFFFSTWWITTLISYLIGFFYFWVLESFNNGQTLGKMALKLRTVDANTFQVPEPGKIAINSLTKPSGFIILDLIIGVIVNSGDPQRKIRYTQNLSETVVIVVK